MRKMKGLLKKVFSLVIVTALVVTGVPTVAFYADTTAEEQEEVLADVTIGENSNETITSDETVEKEEVLEEYQQYVEDGTYDERVAFMQELEVQKSNRLPKATANVSKEGATAEQSQTMPYGGLMPSTGEVKALVFLVDFPDCRQTDGTTAEEIEEQLFFGYGQTFAGFYNNSSYGKLKLDGDVYGYYTTENNREYYNNPNAESIGRQELINELLEYYDDEIDYSDYDADKDGYIDALYIEYVGQDSGWGSFWWSYMTAWDGFVEQVEADGVLVHQYVWMNESTSDEDTYKHETGHLLGLIDYYDTITGSLDGAIGTFDMMYGNMGDHNALSKILLGWIEPIEVNDVTQLELRSSQLYPDAAIVYPNMDKTSDEYFVVEYVTSDAANYKLSSLLDDGGIRVWRVNTKLTEDGSNYAYNNDLGTKKFIEAVGVCNYSNPSQQLGNLIQYDIDDVDDMYDGKKINLYYPGDELTPYSTPSSYIYGDSESFYGPFTTSGVVINDIVITESNATVQISYENVVPQEFDYSLEYTFESAFWAELTFDYEVTLLDESKITVSNGVKEIDVESEVVYLPDYGFKKMYIFSNEKYDLAEKEGFTLTIEQGALLNEFGTSNPKITEDVEAVSMGGTLIKEYNSSVYGQTDMISINNEAYFFCKFEKALSLIRVYENDEGALVTEEMNVFENDDLSYIRAQKYGEKLLLSVFKNQNEWGVFCVYLVDTNGSYMLLYEEALLDGFIPDTYVLGENIIIKKWSSNMELISVETGAIDELENTISNKLQGIWTIGTDRFVAVYYDKIMLVDSEFNIIKEINKDNISQLEKVVDVFEKDGYVAMLTFEQSGTDTDLSLVYYNENMDYVKREQFLNNTHDIIEGTKGMDMVIEYKDGYIIRMEKSNTLMRFSDVLSYDCIPGSVNSVTEFAFFDKEMNYVTSKVFWGKYYGSVCPAEVGDRLVYFNNGLYLDIYELDDVSLATSDRVIERLTLSKNELNLSVGEKYQLIEDYEPYNAIAEVIWESSNENVAIVNDVGLVTVVGKGTVVITATVGDESDLTASCEVSVSGKQTSEVPIDISAVEVLAINNQTYTGSAITPSVTVKDGDTILVKDTDYTVSYSNNVNAGTATVTITGKGNYSGTKEVTFTIVSKSFADATVEDIVNQTYTGSAITPSVTVKDGNKTLVKDTDYTVSYSNNVNAGTATVTITGKGNYSGTKEVTFTIVSKSLANATVSSITNQTYTGSAITPGVTVKDGDTTLVKDTDYTVSYSNNVNVGTATVTITGKGNYSGTKEVTFTIAEKSIVNATVSDITNQSYTGSAITPSVTVKNGDTTLVKDTDYTVSYSNNVNTGTATVTITGKGNYSGTKEVTFTITEKSLANVTVLEIANQTYTGSAITPSVTVTDGDTTLVKDTDYTVSYSNNVNAGTATVTITGKGNYTGTRTLNFTIVKKEEPKPQVPTQITSPSVSVNQSAGSISKITIGTSVQSFRASLNEKNYVKVYQNNQVVSDSVVLATGMEARVMDGNTVVKKYSIIVTGDTNGDGKMNITDMIAIKANILKKTLLNGVYEDAADVNGDGKINVTDFIKIKAALLKKDSIVGVAVK